MTATEPGAQSVEGAEPVEGTSETAAPRGGAPASAPGPAPWAYDPGPPPRSRSVWRSLALVGSLAAVFAVGVVVGSALGFFGFFRGDSPPVVTYGALGEVPHLAALEEGACFAGSISTDFLQFEVGRQVACDRPHRFEAFGQVTAPEPQGGAYDAEGLSWFAGEACHFLFEPYVARDYDESSLDFVPVVPAAAEWAHGARGVRCMLFDFEGGTLHVPARDSGI